MTVGPKHSPSIATGADKHHGGGVNVGNVNSDKCQNVVSTADHLFGSETQ